MAAKKPLIVTRKALISVVLTANAFIWYYLISEFLKITVTSIDQSSAILVWSVHYGGIMFSAIAGFLFSKRIKDRTNFLIGWMVFGAITSLVSMLVNLTYIPNLIALALFWGISLGIGMPACMGYFTESIGTGSRGRVGGIMLLLSGAGMVALGMIGGDNIGLRTFILAAWRIFGLAFLIVFRERKPSVLKVEDTTYRAVLNQRSFILYFVPWIMFALITYLTTPIQYGIIGESAVNFLISMENIIIAISAAIGGFLLDHFGRKRISILGLVLIGLGYSVLGLGDSTKMFNWYFYIFLDGIAWGLLFVIFVVTIWGDLSCGRPSDKFYAIGVLPFFCAKFLQVTIGVKIAQQIPAASIFSFTAFFLFLAVLPLYYAPETLPEKILKERDLKSYVKNAAKKAQKESDKMLRKEKRLSINAETNKKAPSSEKEYNDAVKLAEKYY
ncbi:MAG: MFS transporter [Candidatus Bathyarchaeota archaeon]|nr:MFS transporter [Candidatus Bathyarchaeota archaeon]